MDSVSELDDCLQRLASGDTAARDRIIELCSGRLRALAHRMLRRFPGVRRHDDTDDVFQGAAMRLHRALGQMVCKGESPRSLMALATTHIHRELVDLARRNAGLKSYAANHDTNVTPVTGGDRHFVVDGIASDADSLDGWEQFHTAIAGLPDDQREIFHLVWYLGADQRTIAGLLECSERSVKNYWREAREAVKASLGSDRPD